MTAKDRSPSDRPWPRVVVVGAGFAGLWAARTLARFQCSVLILDRNNYHTFLPLLYQVAAAELEPEQIAFPIRGIFRRHPNVDFAMTEVQGFDLTRRLVTTDTYSYPYDYLLLAAGSMTRFFNVPGAAEYAFRLKTLEQGIALRNQILSCVERADQAGDLELQRQLLTFTIVGGGPTGIEYAGALSELVRRPLARDYPRLDLGASRIVLVEAQDGLLPGFPDNLRRYALSRLKSKGVEVHTRAQVVTVTRDRVELKGQDPIPTETVVWTAGVKGQSMVAGTGLPVTPVNRLRVEPTLQLSGHPEVFAAGDLCAFQQDGGELPMIAPVAIQQGRAAARNIMRLHRGRPTRPFRYRDKGTMATLGRNAAVVRLGRRTFTGFPAWVLWLFVHLLYLIGFRNRLIVLITWAWDYFLVERAVRLILPKDPPWVRRQPPDDTDGAKGKGTRSVPLRR